MELNPTDKKLLAAIQDGLPLVARPFAVIGEQIGCGEEVIIAKLESLIEQGVVKRFGLIVRHHELGYRSNAMSVWDVPDCNVATVGKKLSSLEYVTLCYRRPRRPPDWRYNLFAMIHGRDRSEVEAQIDDAGKRAGLEGVPHAVLFSRRRFKQRGARFD